MSEREKYIEHMLDKMVERFLRWPLPVTVCSDTCASDPTYPHRTGTNLLTADEARQMFRFAMTDEPTFDKFIDEMNAEYQKDSHS